MFRRLTAAFVACVMAVGLSVSPHAQEGVILGRANDAAASPFFEYMVRLRLPDTGEIFATQVLDASGQFLFSGLVTGQPYIIELVDLAEGNELVCSEGPFTLADDESRSYEVNVDCGAPAAALWLLVGAAGIVASVGTLTNSESGGDDQ
jgi:hypothetical protein